MMPAPLFPQPVGAPAQLVVTAEECMAHARVDLEDDAAQLLKYAAAAQSMVERHIETPLTERAMEAFADCWPAAGWRVMQGKIRSVDAIRYIDAAGAEQTLEPSAYVLRERLRAGLIRFTGDPLPDIAPQSEITVSLTAGWSTNGCDDVLKQTVLLLTSNLYDNRGTLHQDTQTCMEALLAPFRLRYLA